MAFILPVIYVCFGQIPNYLLLNIELASRFNDVVVISSSLNSSFGIQKYNNRISFERISSYFSGASEFSPLYVHMVR